MSTSRYINLRFIHLYTFGKYVNDMTITYSRNDVLVHQFITLYRANGIKQGDISCVRIIFSGVKNQRRRWLGRQTAAIR